jgi:hypothetical protein
MKESAAYQAARGNLPGMGAVAALRADAFKQFVNSLQFTPEPK